MEEKRLLQKFKQYQYYKNIVTNKFIPYIIWFLILLILFLFSDQLINYNEKNPYH